MGVPRDQRELASGEVECQLCPKACRVAPGQVGDCRVRVNLDGTLRAVVHSHPVAMHIDPMEKKPLYHFLPGSPILSLATVGCNLHCKNCQNWEISQADPWETESYEVSPDEVVALTLSEGCRAVAYTYTEPLVYYEYTLDTCLVAHEHGLRNVLVSAGYANPAPLRRLYPHVDAANIDLKSMREDFYRDVCRASLRPVLTALEIAKELGVWLEVTNLIIPTLNDDTASLRDLARWIARHLGEDTPLHFSAFTPRYQLQNLPRTPAETLLEARTIALDEGLRYVYVGNVLGTAGSDTRCHRCDALLIERVGFRVQRNTVDAVGRCSACGEPVAGVWQ